MGSLKPPPSLLSLLGDNKHRGVISGIGDAVSGSRNAFHRSEAGPCVVCTTTQQVDGETLDGITRVRPDLKAVFSITNPVLLFR